MENTSNALLMAGAILLFVFALSVGVYLYSKIFEINDSILTTSEKYNNTAEDFNLNYVDTDDITRTISSAEIANQILEMARQSKDFHYYHLKVGVNPTYTSSSFPGIQVGEELGKTIVEDESHSTLDKALYNLNGNYHVINDSLTFSDGVTQDNVSIAYQ